MIGDAAAYVEGHAGSEHPRYAWTAGAILARTWQVGPEHPSVGSRTRAVRSSGPDHDTIVSGTGAYTGAGGRVNGWGVVDAHALPAQLGYDMFTLIRLAPGGDRLSAASPPDRIAQYCTSDGENTSSEPTHFVAQEVQSEVSLVPDPQRPGFGLVGARPGHDTITAASGVFAGRTGHVDISGSVDLRRFPAAAPFEGVSLVSLGP